MWSIHMLVFSLKKWNIPSWRGKGSTRGSNAKEAYETAETKFSRLSSLSPRFYMAKMSCQGRELFSGATYRLNREPQRRSLSCGLSQGGLFSVLAALESPMLLK